MMKILMLNYEFPPIGGGGGQAHLALLQQYARNNELRVDVLTSAPRPGFVMERFASNVLIFRVGIRKRDLHHWRKREVIEWLLKADACYRRFAKAEHYDLVHAFFGFPTGWLCRRTAGRLPYILSLRGSDVPGANARLRFEYKLLGPLVFKPIWKKASALVACSEGLKARALTFLPTAEIQVIPNGVDLERFSPLRARAEPGVLRLLTVGRLSATKRLPVLIGAMELLGREGPAVRLTVVGGGALRRDLEKAVARCGLNDVVRFTGRVESQEMPQVYREHDVLVSASMQEGMSNAMLEAMACGLPIVTTRCEGVDELVGDNGVVVTDCRPATLAQAVRALADDRPRRRAMSEAARKRAEQFSWAAVADAYLQLYAKLT